MKTPDFFIVGAPKCGTTALATYFSKHPGIFMSPIKEPNYFCFDRGRARAVTDAGHYARLFYRAAGWQLCGEASTAYLFSPEAVPWILRAKPSAKIIAMVRNPVDMVESLHAQKVFTCDETETDFDAAWRMSTDRRESPCAVTRYLDYQRVGMLGQQIERLMSWVPPSQLHVIVFDDLKMDPESVYRGVLPFLGTFFDGRRDFGVVNARRERRWPMLARLVRHPPGAKWAARIGLKKRFAVEIRGLRDKIDNYNSKPGEVRLNRARRHYMAAHFREDVELLGHLLKRDLTHWTNA